MNEGANILCKKLKENSILKVAGAFDAMSAKLVELNNFDAVWEEVLLFLQLMYYLMQVY